MNGGADLKNKAVVVEEDEMIKDHNDEDQVIDTDEEGEQLQGLQGPVAADALGDDGGITQPREQDRLMPIANVNRIMRKVLPTHAKITEETKGFVQQCVYKFMGYVTAEANDRCRQEQRKTVTAEDMLYAFTKLGFPQYAEHLCVYLNRYRVVDGNHRPARRDVLAEGVRAAAASSSAVSGLCAATAPGVDSVTGARLYPVPSGMVFAHDQGGRNSIVGPGAAAAAGGVPPMPGDVARAAPVAGPSIQVQGGQPPLFYESFGQY